MTLPEALLRELADLLGDDLRTDPGERVGYGYDNSRREALPDAVVR